MIPYYISIRIIVFIIYLMLGIGVCGLIDFVRNTDNTDKMSWALLITVMLIWPAVALTFIFNWLFRLFFWLIKKPLFWLIWIVLIFVLLHKLIPAEAAVITGEQHLYGGSVAMDIFTEYLEESEDDDLLASVMYLENYNNGEYIMYLTGAVVINRVARGWGNSIKEVLYSPGQYATKDRLLKKEPPEICYKIARRLLLLGCPDVPETVVYQAMFKQGHGIYYVENGEYFCYE